LSLGSDSEGDVGDLLKKHLGPKVVKTLASHIKAVWPGFSQERFEKFALKGFDDLELMARGQRIAEALDSALPDEWSECVSILMCSVDHSLRSSRKENLNGFFWLPHTFFVTLRGMRAIRESNPSARAGILRSALLAQARLTMYFSAEFSIRPWLISYESETLKFLLECTNHNSEHVRRLASEGSRPRLPWSFRLRRFQEFPTLQLPILDALVDDLSPYVRKSVANHLNDIAKDHPDFAITTADRWLREKPSKERRWIVRHGLRTLVKAGHPEALKILGFGQAPVGLTVAVSTYPRRPRIGQKVEVRVHLESKSDLKQGLLVDFGIMFRKASGICSIKVFKLKELAVENGESIKLSKKVSLAQHTTRKHWPGKHKVHVLINGVEMATCDFILVGQD
jgi:3-methyladenine DNA glycosylase AlkC